MASKTTSCFERFSQAACFFCILPKLPGNKRKSAKCHQSSVGKERIVSPVFVLGKDDYQGGRYAYLDGFPAGLGAVIELLENF